MRAVSAKREAAAWTPVIHFKTMKLFTTEGLMNMFNEERNRTPDTETSDLIADEVLDKSV